MLVRILAVVVVGCAWSWHYVIQHALKQTDNFRIPDQTGKLIIVTGANSGLGLETAISLAGAGAHVIMACRSLKSCSNEKNKILSTVLNEEQKNLLTCMEFDLMSFDSIRAFAEQFIQDYITSAPLKPPAASTLSEPLERGSKSQRGRKLDTLINNAGIMFVPLQHTEEGLESTVGVNYVGHFLLTGLLLPHMSKNARIVNHSSMAALMVHPFWPEYYDLKSGGTGWIGLGYNSALEYGHSKRAMLYFSWELNTRLRAAGSNIRCVSVQPGYTATNLQKDKIPFWEYLNRYVAMNPSQGAQPQLVGATTAGNYHGVNVLDVDSPVVIGPSLLLMGGPAVQSSALYTLHESTQSRERRQQALWEKSVKETKVMHDLVLR